MRQIAAWLKDYQQSVNASAEKFAVYHQQEREHGKSIIELFEPAQGLNLNIDRD